ncbi:bifunctional D-glycero-beta-D-manno-heptose-7-phosphate kinase/D-glycero-beta-D-manno-heptose 1-phosphate adenylyltransferase HldE [Aggregatibacter actinomycetemcomitans]|uniref:bifunctional D-glycero-beta-D-manno-heptose-7-phosphate kinase/D-glycero-beta-D-manno-heptose 1-phosphate adenylyltransferase HldE n=1 Tax=Aggregatibacter actinomycetemcomitans TaxID=714 RepID=UPI0011D937CE|nr:bifunctional D-glycero-beta-D-manno-heptose-7-phosphate kinase/D-glycero-beta-D-manno-heptose 1-phosphate adenylyltransferase HldE [Aggregatibacter actinomycetemcomitans]QEH45595.1 bifunctional D-glycero-beta-D-manno-heptose-7-phosphate kinase/D-glycero-beta-D-manno-heptose 1-phosphate adenylyltransferase HldE [Aggregatibacter actinomycetemcomitans]TYA51414.1 bifunctional D-glycero-beta-D-manno-heptose-7-phosphate kinase/D-glycero-beta-D-manno-heptose 1-phosphate adenylyltransferase HldE [Aggr
MAQYSAQFNHAKVLVLGDVMLDRYWFGATNRISPEAPVPVVRFQQNEERAGGAANVAMNIASLNVPVQLLGLTGQDEAGAALTTLLQQQKIDCDFVRLATHPTITKLRILSRHQQLLRLDFEEDFQNVTSADLLKKLESAVKNYGALILSDYGKGTLNEVQKMIQIARNANVPVLIDPKGTDFERYRGATLLTPNMSEFEAVVGKCHSEQEIIDKGLKLISEINLTALLVTRSEKGMTLLRPNQPVYHLPTEAKEVFDVTGAGDTVISVLATALADGRSFEEACYLANVAAGIVVGKLGTSTVSTVELENAIHGRTGTGFGVMTEAELKDAVKLAKDRGEKIVMTNGCFDILHPGHVSYLDNARKLGDRLIVAVNTDDSVKRLKGEERPINNLASRMAVLAGLSSVDWLVPFGEDTPQRLIGEVLPDLLVKGGDYKPEEIAGSKEVWANGGDVKVLNFENGFSTSNVIKKIKHLEK